MPMGASVTVLGAQENGFLPVSYGGTQGYASAEYLSFAYETPIPVPTASPTPSPTAAPPITANGTSVALPPAEYVLAAALLRTEGQFRLDK